jgi:hypothetical protein
VIAPVVAVAAVQAAAMAVDEGYFHAARGLPRWERIGHPLDTLTVTACYGWLSASTPHSRGALEVYVALSALSCVFVTKDEPIHARLCTGAEHWLHAVLFVLHPVVLGAFGWAWWSGHETLLHVQLALTVAFGAYQLARWSFRRVPS